MNWRAGDIAEIVNCPWWHHCGATATLLRWAKHPDLGREGWFLDLAPASPHSDVFCGEEYFRKPYDGNKKTEWKTCVFQPKELVVVN